jgi:hypothetical protein
MSFKSVFSKVVHAVTHEAPKVGEITLKVVSAADSIAQVASPFIVPFLGPEAAAAEALINKGIDWAESAIQIEQQGVAKKQGASAIVTAEITNAEPILQAFGLSKNFTPSAATLSAISTAIDAFVASRNALAGVLASVKAQGTPVADNAAGNFTAVSAAVPAAPVTS